MSSSGNIKKYALKGLEMGVGICADLLKCSPPQLLGLTLEQLNYRFKSKVFKNTRETKTPLTFKNISDFWKKVGERQVEDGRLVSIKGQLSTYCPLWIGAPKVKRNLHLSFRKKLQEGPFNDRVRSELNARLAYTSGQMVWRLDLSENPLMYLGLYHSIVRNCIPVFVEADYFQKHLKKVFAESSNQDVMEAEIRGLVVDLPSIEATSVLTQEIFKDYIRPRISEEEGGACGLLVYGEETSVEYVDEARYLDGDIWVAIEDHGVQHFESRFVDLADKSDLKDAKANLKEELGRDPAFDPSKIGFEFDQLSRLFPACGEVAKKEDILSEAFK